jgi:hypothetical protein
MINVQNRHSFSYAFRLETRFATPDSYLEISIPSEASKPPPDANFALYIVQRGRHRLIRWLEELAGDVRIDTPEAALAYVRLYTSPRTYYLFAEGQRMPLPSNLLVRSALEIIPHTWVNEGLVFGDRELLDRLRRVSNTADRKTAYGIVKPGVLPKPMEFATVRRARGGFLIRRPLMVKPLNEEEGSPRLLVFEEWVGSSGQIKRKKATPLDDSTVQQLSLVFPARY